MAVSRKSPPQAGRHAPLATGRRQNGWWGRVLLTYLSPVAIVGKWEWVNPPFRFFYIVCRQDTAGFIPDRDILLSN